MADGDIKCIPALHSDRPTSRAIQPQSFLFKIMAIQTSTYLIAFILAFISTLIIRPNMFSALKNAIGFETIPAAVRTKSFYDLKAELPGKDRFLDFVSAAAFGGRTNCAKVHAGWLASDAGGIPFDVTTGDLRAAATRTAGRASLPHLSPPIPAPCFVTYSIFVDVSPC